MRIKRSLFSLVLLSLFVSLVLNAAPSEPVAGDAFVAASTSEPTNLVPFLASDSASAGVAHFIFSGLLKYDENLELAGDLAESWDVSEDGLRIVFHLKKNLRWQDAHYLTAEDVVFTYQQITNPKVPTPYSSAFEKVQSVTAVDSRTVEVVYTEPFAPGLSSWTMGIVPKHILLGQDISRAPFVREPIGSGPYYLLKWERGQSLILRSNPYYFEGKPFVDRVVIRILPDAATSFLELQMEDLDTADLTPLQFNRQIDTEFFKKNYKTYRWTGQQYTYLGYNLNNPLFQDKRVRRALGMAVDPREMIQAALLGHGRPITGPFLPESWAYDPTVKPLSYDPQEAKRLLEEAGWRDSDRDGVLDRDGKKFTFTVLTNGGNDERKMVCEILQKQLSQIGVRVEIRIVEWGTLLTQFIHPKRFDAVLMGWNMGLDPDVYDIFHSSRTGPGQFNFVSFRDPEVDRLLEEGRKTFDRQKRAEIYHRIHAIIYDEQPYNFLFTSESLSVLHRRYENVTEGKMGNGFDFHRWFVPKDRQKYPALAS